MKKETASVRQNEAYEPNHNHTKKPKTQRGAYVSVAIALIVVAVVAILLHSGNIIVFLEDTSVTIKAPFWADFRISYEEIDTVAYQNSMDVGERTVGVGSARLSVGTFKNNEFGSYTLYAYADSTEFVVFTSGEKTIVIGMGNEKDTKEVYHMILERMNNES